METLFTIECPGWYDPDLPLSYKFSYIIRADTTQENLIYIGSEMSPEPFNLPVGPKENNYTFNLTATISDAFGSYAEVDFKVRVRISFILTL